MLRIGSKKGKRILGIDSSTNSIAYALIIDGRLTDYGQIVHSGSTVYDRLKSAKKNTEDLKNKYNPDLVFIEDTVNVRSVQVAIKMAYFASLVFTTFDKVTPIAPMTWQNYIGNKKLTTAEKLKIAKENPGKSKTWLQNKYREFRKQRTIDWVSEQFGVDIESNDITDSVAIAWVGYNK